MALATLLNAVTATGASNSMGTDSNKPAFLQVSGITSATVAAQGSVDNTTWATIGTALTADGLITITNPPPFIRANVTVFVTGTITVKAST
jgi:hypothetical protein